MSITTTSPRLITLTPQGPDVQPLADIDTGVAEQLGDDILMAAASSERTRKVAGKNGSQFQSHTARAWTRGGQVD